MRKLSAILLLVGLSACGSPEQAWELAEREDTNQGYLEFLAKYPEGEFADQARARMDRLKLERAWERAQFRDRLDNYEKFLSDYPDSDFAAPARARVYELTRDEAWDVAVDEQSIAALENFLAVYPDAPQAPEARALIGSLAPPEPEPELLPPPERPGDFRLQVGAFRTAMAAEREVRRLDARYRELLRGPIRIVTPLENGGSRFLLRTVPMSMAEAQSSCDALQRARQDCFVINK